MNINLKKINFFLIIKYLYPITITLIIIVLLFLLRFLYSNVYQTIIQAELITDLRKETSDENLQKNKFDQVTRNIESKLSTSEINTNNLKDPFKSLITPVVPVIPIISKP